MPFTTITTHEGLREILDSDMEKIDVTLHGLIFDNTGNWPITSEFPTTEKGWETLECHVIIYRNGGAIGAVNLYDLFQWLVTGDE